MASKQDVYLVLEAVRLLSEDVSFLHKKVDTGSELVAEGGGGRLSRKAGGGLGGVTRLR
jgi:hypothetical protein